MADTKSKPGFSIPLIDFSKFLSGAEEERLHTAKAILSGFQTAGFIYLYNLPLTPAERQHIFGASAAYFRQSDAAKMAQAMPSIQSNRGYNSTGQEKLDANSPSSDLKETLHVGRDNDPEYANIWPPAEGELASFRADISGFYDFCARMAVEVMRAIGVGLGTSDTYFDSFMANGDHKLRMLHYPSVDKQLFRDQAGTVRAGAHTDYGAVTLLFQDNRGGLQVKTPDGNYMDATPIENAIVVNAGDLLSRWSNDTIKSTVHRVVEPPTSDDSTQYPERYSIAFFANPHESSYIDAIPGTFKTDADKKYKGITSGQYYIERLAGTY